MRLRDEIDTIAILVGKIKANFSTNKKKVGKIKANTGWEDKGQLFHQQKKEGRSIIE